MESYNAVKVRSKGSYNKNRKTGLRERNEITEFYIQETAYRTSKYVKEMNGLELATLCIISDDDKSMELVQKLISNTVLTNK
jgi:hypothetical protein